MIRLFRAVTPPELASIYRMNAFSNPAGVERKYFSLTLEGARRYAIAAEDAFGDGPFAIVQTSIDPTLVSADSRAVVDRGIFVLSVPTTFCILSPSLQSWSTSEAEV